MSYNTSEPKKNYISGEWLASDTVGKSFSPANGENLGGYFIANADQVNSAIDSAVDVFESTDWKYNRELRAQVLNEMADAIVDATDELALMLARENGKILGEAYFELSLVPSKLRYYAGQALVDTGRGAQAKKGSFSLLLPQPVGVVGVIVPWNSPVVLAIRSFAPAIAAGCTVVMKMVAQTALVNARLMEVLASCPSLPKGVLNIFTESEDVGAKMLVSSPKVPALSYTGSTAIGRQIMADAAPKLKRLSLELGGKTPMIVFNDANVDQAVGTIAASITTFSGQFCMTGSRVLVQRSIANEVREKLRQTLEAVRVGPGDDPDSSMGPMIDMASRDRLVELIGSMTEGDAEIIVAGGPPDNSELVSGAYYRPSLIAIQDLSSPLIQRELFGPIATFEVFEDEADALKRANATQYGLSASVWTANGARGLQMADELDAGSVWINGWAAVYDQFEEGGFKQSGLGRLNGNRAIEEFQELKHVLQFI